jgi:hypothetical protein
VTSQFVRAQESCERAHTWLILVYLAKMGPTAALHVYLSYTLSATLEFHAQLLARDDRSVEVDGCVAACETVLRYVRSAQHVCGALGLVAIDRSQEGLRLKIKNLSAEVSHNADDKTLSSVAALCYVNALNRRCHGDFELYELWSFAAVCVDNITSRKPNQFRVVAAADHTRKFLTSRAVKFDANRKAAFKSGRTWHSNLLGRVSHLCRLAVVCSLIPDIYYSGKSILPVALTTVHLATKQRYLAAQSAVTMFERNVIVCDIANRVHPVEIQGLVRVAAQRLEEAVELVAARPTVAPESYGQEDGGQTEDQCKGDIMASNASILSGLAAALSAALTKLAVVRSTTAAPEPFLDNVADQLQRLTAEITASTANGGGGAVHVTEKKRLYAQIERITEQLLAVQNSSASWEERAVKRYLAEARGVRREVSPAHSHISESWLQAATHMRRAVDDHIAADVPADSQRSAKHKICSKMYEKLAAGTFGDAATCFAKAESTPCAHARPLWKEAAELLVQVGIAKAKRVEEVAAQEWFSSATFTPQCDTKATKLRCALPAEGAHAGDVDAVVATLSGFRSAVLRASHGGSEVKTVLQLRLLLVHVERAALENPLYCYGPHSAMQRLGALTEAVLLMSQSALVVLPTYPEGHLLHLSPEPPDKVLQRSELLHWLCRIPVECYERLRQALEGLRASINYSVHYTKAVDAVATAVRMADSIRWYTDATGRNPPAYRVHTYEQANVYRVLCKISLAASSEILAERPLTHALLVRAMQQQLPHRAATPFTTALSNALVHRAWELSAMPGQVPSGLLFPTTENSVGAAHEASLQEIVDAHVQQATHTITLAGSSFRVQKEASLHSSAIEHYGYVISDHMQHVSKGVASRAAGTCARAMRAANWFGCAVEALHNRRCEEAGLYERATHFCVAIKLDASQNVQAQRVGDQAAAQFVAAAKALSTGDRPLYQSWLTAAEATAALLDVSQRTSKSTAPSKIAFSADYSTATLAAANRLAAQALAQQGTRQVSTSQQNGAVLAGSVGLQASEPALAAPPAQETVHGRVGTRRSKRAAEVKADAGAESTASSMKRKRS